MLIIWNWISQKLNFMGSKPWRQSIHFYIWILFSFCQWLPTTEIKIQFKSTQLTIKFNAYNNAHLANGSSMCSANQLGVNAFIWQENLYSNLRHNAVSTLANLFSAYLHLFHWNHLCADTPNIFHFISLLLLTSPSHFTIYAFSQMIRI